MTDSDPAPAFRDRGVATMGGLLDEATCATLDAALEAIVATRASETAAGSRVDDFWVQMRRSAAEIEVFWMPGAKAKGYGPGEVARVGHGLHLRDEAFAELALRSPVAEVLALVLGSGARIVQSAVVVKQPRSDFVQFGFHQDAAYLTSESLALAFVALDDCDAENGALLVAPHSHERGIGERLRLGPTGFERHAGAPRRIERDRSELVPMRRGDVAILDGRTYHASDPNRSDRRRRGVIVHAIAASAKLEPTSWVAEPAEGFPELGAQKSE